MDKREITEQDVINLARKMIGASVYEASGENGINCMRKYSRAASYIRGVADMAIAIQLKMRGDDDAEH